MLKRFGILFIGFLIWSIVPFSSYAQSSIKVAAIKIPLMIETPDKGVFIDILKEISKRTGLTFDISVYPGKRAHGLFKQKKVDILIPFPKGNRTQSGLLSDPIYIKRDFIFVRRGYPIPKNLDDFGDGILGITSHYRYKPSLYEHKSLNLDKSQSDELNMRKLHNGRIDGFLVEEFSGLAAIEKTATPHIMYNKDYPIFTYEAVMLLKDGIKGKEYTDKINKALSAMIDDGSYKKIISFIQNKPHN